MKDTKNRQKISILEITSMFPDDKTAEEWFIKTRWNGSIKCTSCNSSRISERKTKMKSWRCKDCRKDFSTKTNTIMQGSNLGFRVWAIAIYILTTSLKGVASTKLASDLNITQKSAWHLAMRIRESYKNNVGKLSGIVEVDESYFGGKEKNKHTSKKLKAGRGAVGKQAVIGAKQRGGKIVAQTLDNTKGADLQGFINETVETGSNVMTDDHRGYLGMEGYNHDSVSHSVGEYVRDQAHTNGIESFWALLKRGYNGTHHHMSKKHIGQYVNEFAGRHNTRSLDTMFQMADIMYNMIGKRLKYKDLIA